MSSHAKEAFVRAAVDVDNLLWFHEEVGGDGQGKRGRHFQSLNKSAIVLLCAAWETYIETVILECADRNIDAAVKPADMLRSLQKITQTHIRDGKVENAWISAAGDGWKELTKSLARNKVSSLNNPKPGPIIEIMKAVLDIEDVSDNWIWHKNPLGTPSRQLKDFVILRGGIAHGERPRNSVTKSVVNKSYDLIVRSVDCIEIKLAAVGLLPQ